MKIHRHIKTGILPAAALLLAVLTPQARAQQEQQYVTETFSFPTTGPSEGQFADPTWFLWYNNGTVQDDATTDISNPVPGANTSDSGSLEFTDTGFTPTSNTQGIFFGCFSDKTQWDGSVTCDAVTYQSVDFDILVNPSTALDTNNSPANFGYVNVGVMGSSEAPNYSQPINSIGSVAIPAAASSGWVHISVPFTQAQAGAFMDPLNIEGIELGINQYNTGAYPSTPFTCWFDNISFVASSQPPPPPPTLLVPTPAVTGLNCLATTAGDSGAQDNRYQIGSTNTSCSFVGQSKTTYSWTIKEFPTNDATSVQAHFMIVNGVPGQYDQAADYNLADCIFFTIQADTNGDAIANFRYKTNEAGANSMFFNSVSPTNTASNPNGWPIMPIVSWFTSNSIIGTWSLSFSGNTSVTITDPQGGTTNFVWDAASAALFASPATLLLGAQPNNYPLPQPMDVVYGNFSVTGSASDFSDDFATDTTLNPTYWYVQAEDPNGVQLVPPGTKYMFSWTLPATGFGLAQSSTLPATTWQTLNSSTPFLDGLNESAFVATTNLINNGAGDDYFALVQRVLSQLVVLLPGETFTPGVAPGYSGSPTTIANGPAWPDTATVYAVDSGYQLISSDTDSITLECTTDSAGAGDFVVGNNGASYGVVPMTGGIASFTGNNSFSWGNGGLTAPATETVTAIDTSATPNITNSSAPVNLTGN